MQIQLMRYPHAFLLATKKHRHGYFHTHARLTRAAHSSHLRSTGLRRQQAKALLDSDAMTRELVIR